MAASINFRDGALKHVYIDSLKTFKRCEARGLVQSSKWLAELALAVEDENSLELNQQVLSQVDNEISAADKTKHSVAITWHQLREYRRAEHLTRSCSSPPVQFLHYYCKYLACENEKNQHEVPGIENEDDVDYLAGLCDDLGELSKDEKLDAYLMYLYGVVLKKCGYTEDAMGMFVKSVNEEPCFWGSWYELAGLINERNDLDQLQLPDHWMRHFFLALTYLALQMSDMAADIYSQLIANGFNKSSYTTAQLAVSYDNMKDVDMAIRKFEELRVGDPYRLENMDTYSNALYVKEMRVELANLAAQCVSLDKYRAETCCVIGNYYSLREQHEHAVLHFKRALKLNPNFISAWTLMGHEYMELNNQSAAIQAYRKALDVDGRDFRAWYGLGQTHEILKMNHYSLYYYQRALKLRPNDSRMLMAVGCAFKLLNKAQEAKICFWKAHMLGDPEGIALTHLAKLHESLKEDENAAAAFTKFVLDAVQSEVINPRELAHAYKFLANHNLRIENYEEAYIAAQKCVDFPETREEGKALLHQITQTRGIPEEISESANPLPMEANDSLTQELFYRRPTTPAPHLSPMNLRFHTPDH